MAVASGKPSLGDGGSRGAGAAPSNWLTRHMTAVNCRQAATTSHFSAGGAAVLHLPYRGRPGASVGAGARTWAAARECCAHECERRRRCLRRPFLVLVPPACPRRQRRTSWSDPRARDRAASPGDCHVSRARPLRVPRGAMVRPAVLRGTKAHHRPPTLFGERGAPLGAAPAVPNPVGDAIAITFLD